MDIQDFYEKIFDLGNKYNNLARAVGNLNDLEEDKEKKINFSCTLENDIVLYDIFEFSIIHTKKIFSGKFSIREQFPTLLCEDEKTIQRTILKMIYEDFLKNKDLSNWFVD